jgi:preprotein translocase subunit SecE
LANGDLLLYEAGGAAPRGPAPRVFLAEGCRSPSRKFQGPIEAMTNPFEFIQQVRAEAAKVIWPTRRETLITTGLVLLLVVFTSVFFLVVDEVLRTIVSLVLGFGRSG